MAKVALVTGSTSGIGLAIAHDLLQNGCHVIVTGIIEVQDKEILMKELRSKYKTRVEFVEADLCKVSDIESLCTTTLSLFPEGVDILVNNAGFNYVANISEFPDLKWDEMVAVMLSAPFHLCKRLIPSMHQKGWGRIVNIASQMGIAVSSPGKAAYSAVKSGLVGLTRGIALEEGRAGITCNAVCPGFAEAPVFERQVEKMAKDRNVSYETILDEQRERIPTGSLVQASQIAELVRFLCFSKAGEQITGACQLIDGAFTVQ